MHDPHFSQMGLNDLTLDHKIGQEKSSEMEKKQYAGIIPPLGRDPWQADNFSDFDDLDRILIGPEATHVRLCFSISIAWLKFPLVQFIFQTLPTKYQVDVRNSGWASVLNFNGFEVDYTKY